jgi:hypothetical protein
MGWSSEARCALSRFLQTPHVPPFFAQCAQYLQFLQALHGSAPVQVANIPSELKPEASTTAHIKSPSVVIRLFINTPRDYEMKCSPFLGKHEPVWRGAVTLQRSGQPFHEFLVLRAMGEEDLHPNERSAGNYLADCSRTWPEFTATVQNSASRRSPFISFKPV